MATGLTRTQRTLGGIYGPHGGQKGQERERQRRILLPRCGSPEPVLRSLDRRLGGADRVVGVTDVVRLMGPLAWMINEGEVCILITRRKDEMWYWWDRGCTVVPLYAMPPL